MSETQAIIDAYQRARADNVRGALATVVRVEGSAYRRPGVRMFITETAEITGMLSGGCLEADVCEHAVKVIRSNRPRVVTYDTTSDDDIVWGLGLGCNGVVKVLIEPANGERVGELVRLLTACSAQQQRGALATVIEDRSAGTAVGARVLHFPDGTMARDSDLDEGMLGAWIIDDLRQAFQLGQPAINQYETADGATEVFFEVVEPRLPLVIFGAGDDALPLVKLAGELGWQTTVVDTRARPSTASRFADADAVLLCRPEEIGDRVHLTNRTAVVIMTHNFMHDLEVVRTLIDQPVGYAGLLGPRRRAERLLLEIGDGPAAAFLDRLHAPAGLDVGAETPAEIAISIVAEIKAVLNGREGGLLRHRVGSIHSSPPLASVPATWPVRASSNGWLLERVSS